MSTPNVERQGRGESSIIVMGYRMTQAEARSLCDALSRVVLMAPRVRRPAREVERCSECGHAESRHNELGYCSVSSPTKGDCMCGSVRTPLTHSENQRRRAL